MSRLDEYVAGAVSTESTLDEVHLNKQFLKLILSLHIASGNILDQIKKHAFYRRDYNQQTIDRNLATMLENLTNISYMTVDELEDAEVALDIDPRIFHAIIGTATESVELLEALEFDGKEMDLVNIGEEFGDANWYQAIFCDAAGIKWEDILDTNAQKLFKAKEARYKDGFKDEDANERNLEGERNVLDKLKIKPA
jgi:NTP pyrophosphatase (non-canonical NTP hydrolase)